MLPRFGNRFSATKFLNLCRTDLSLVEREISVESVASVEAITTINQYLQAGGGKRLRRMLLLC